MDDTENVVCKWKRGIPSIPLDQVHVAVWERATLYQKKSSSGVGRLAEKCREDKAISGLSKRLDTGSSILSKDNSTGNHSSIISKTDFSQHKVSSENLKTLSDIPSDIKVNSSISIPKLNNDRQNSVKAERGNVDSLPSCLAAEKKSKELDVKTECNDTKRKNTFEPYIPRKKRLLCTNETSQMKNEEKTKTEDIYSPVRANGNKQIMEVSTGLWKGVTLIEKDKQGSVGSPGDNQSDSGYSSPASNNSSVSLPLRSTKEEAMIINEIIDTLDEIDLPSFSECMDSEGVNLSSSRMSRNTDIADSRVMDSIATDMNEKQLDYSCGVIPFTNISSSNDRAGKISELASDGKLNSPCNFLDIETVSNTGSDFMDDIEFLESMDFSNSTEEKTSTKGKLPDFSTFLLPYDSKEDTKVLKVAEATLFRSTVCSTTVQENSYTSQGQTNVKSCLTKEQSFNDPKDVGATLTSLGSTEMTCNPKAANTTALNEQTMAKNEKSNFFPNRTIEADFVNRFDSFTYPGGPNLSENNSGLKPNLPECLQEYLKFDIEDAITEDNYCSEDILEEIFAAELSDKNMCAQTC